MGYEIYLKQRSGEHGFAAEVIEALVASDESLELTEGAWRQVRYLELDGDEKAIFNVTELDGELLLDMPGSGMDRQRMPKLFEIAEALDAIYTGDDGERYVMHDGQVMAVGEDGYSMDPMTGERTPYEEPS